MRSFIFSIILLSLFQTAFGTPEQDSLSTAKNTVYVLPIRREIGSTSWIHMQKAFEKAEALNAKTIILHMNTYGGLVNFADSMRTKILNSQIPVHVFIDNNAASAGALISIACKNIFMRPGASIGAATVVNQSGEKMPDKYQSYMRATIRATAEAHGKDTLIVKNDTITTWVRDPHVAEAMVDESINIPGVIDSTKILTFTTQEAIQNNFCEGEANNIAEVVELLGIDNYEIIQFSPSFYDGLKGFLTGPMLQGILILIIIGGIYFELQTPGVGFPLAASAIAAVIYFAPLYIDGIAENWEISLFLIGIALIALEVFVIPGFGIAGISGITLVITGLTLSLVENVVFDFSNVKGTALLQALLMVVTAMFSALILGIFFSRKMATSGALSKLALHTTQEIDDGYLSVENGLEKFIGTNAITETVMRPSGKITIENETYDARAENGYIEKDQSVEVVQYESGQLIVRKS